MYSDIATQLIPPPDLAPPSIKHLPFEKRIELWLALVDESEALVKAGLLAKIGPKGNLEETYGQWYTHRMEERDRQQIRFAENLSHLERGNGN